MTFFLSKFLWHVFNPFNLILIFLIFSIILNYFNYNKFSKIIFLLLVVIFFITGVLPTGSYLMHLLEKKYHNEIILPENIDGIIILAGATNPFLTNEHNQISLNDSVERLTESIYVMKKFPDVKVYFAGGSGSLQYPSLSHSYVAKSFYKSLNVNIDKIYFDDRSRNTYENILFAKQKYNPKENEKWIIITSAFHQNRAINIGKKLDWNLISYPTDFKTAKKFSWKISMNFLKNLSNFQKSTHEWLGLISYYLMGRSIGIL